MHPLPILLSTLAAASGLPRVVLGDEHTLFEFRSDVYACAAVGDVDADGIPDFLIATNSGRSEIRSGRTGQLVHEVLFSAPPSGHPFLGPAGDLDQDGHDDYFVRSFVFSGRTGEIMFRTPGELMVLIDDVDGDGRRELLVGQPDQTVVRCGGDQITIGVGVSTGKAWVVSGPRGEVVYELEARNGSKAFGGGLAALGDLDGDGMRDFAVLEQTAGFWNTRPCGLPQSTIHIFSARSGEHLWQIQGNAMDVAAVDDVNGDGVPDVAVGNFAVEIRSGVDGALLSTLAAGGTNLLDFVGLELEQIPDLDGDHVRELLVAGNQRLTYGLFGSFSAGPGFVTILSPRTGALLSRVEGDDNYDAFGTWMAGLGDVNGDEVYDYIAYAKSGAGEDYARVVSSAPLLLSSDVHEVSITTGGAQTLSINVPLSAGSTRGILLGSLSGTAPGLQLGATHIPLVPDSYFNSLLAGQTTLINASPYITLDASGHASRDVLVPAGLPLELAGRTVHHAFVLLEPSQPISPARDGLPQTLLVSSPVPLSLVP